MVRASPLQARMCRHSPPQDTTNAVLNTFHLTGRLPPDSYPLILHQAYLLNLPTTFAIASRQMMWSMSSEDVKSLLPQTLLDLSPVDFLEAFKQEAKRMRWHLIQFLPAVFFPDSHKVPDMENPGPCQKWSMVSMEGRWYIEVISRSATFTIERQHGPVLSIEDIFNDYVVRMASLTQSRSLSAYAPEQTPFPCGRFRQRHVDITKSEKLSLVYQRIPGLCLKCAKGGNLKYAKWHCMEHDIKLLPADC